MHKVDNDELSALFDTDNEDEKPGNDTSDKKATAQTSQGGVFGKSGKNPPVDNASSAPTFPQPISPTTSVKVK